MNRLVRNPIFALAVLAAAAVSTYAQQDTVRVAAPDTAKIEIPVTDTLAGAPMRADSIPALKFLADSLAVRDSLKLVALRDSIRNSAGSLAVCDSLKLQALRDSIRSAAGSLALRDSLRKAIDAITVSDSLMMTADSLARCDSLLTQKDTLSVLDSLRMRAPAIGVNLAWAGIATPNISFEMPLGENFSAGVSAALKPRQYVYWPRWIPWDPDRQNATKWHHLAVNPYLRWWPETVFDGFFLGADLLYAHYNIAGIRLPLGIYPDIAEHRLQGDFFGAGVSAGASIWMSKHLNLVLSAGILGGYKNATMYECPQCGAELGKVRGAELVPKLDISIAYHLFDEKRER